MFTIELSLPIQDKSNHRYGSYRLKRSILLPFVPFVGLGLEIPTLEGESDLIEVSEVFWQVARTRFLCNCRLKELSFASEGQFAVYRESMISDGWRLDWDNSILASPVPS